VTKATIVSTREIPLRDLERHPENPNRRNDVEDLRQSLRRFGQYRTIVVQESRMRVIAGTHVFDAAGEEGWPTIKANIIDVDDDTALAILIADNRLAEFGVRDPDTLTTILRQLDTSDLGLDGTGYTTADLAELLSPARAAVTKPLAERFLVPPFTVLDSRRGYWRERKAEWLALGIRSELGRKEDLAMDSLSGRVPDYYDQKRTIEAYLGRELPNKTFEEKYLRLPENESTMGAAGTSIFDPVLVEIACRWFAPTGGTILDPFAGGSVRGVVAAILGHPYTGMDLAADQLEANRAQWQAIDAAIPDAGPAPDWQHGDSSTDLPDGPADLILTCPPYYDLEKYSDDERDLSNMTYPRFLETLDAIIRATLDRLRKDRFAVWVVGDVRDKHGNYRGLVADTIRLHQQAGAHLYNDAILVTPTGSLAVTAGRQFEASRKLGKQHQNVLIFGKEGEGPIAEAVADTFTKAWQLGRNHTDVLVFAKGDGKKATAAAGPVAVDTLPEL
jgi:ParB-like chromosome segregation protein Spo0J